MLKEYKGKKVITETSKLDIRVPRDREGTFDCPLSTAFPWFRRQDRVDVCARRADAVLETVGERQNRPLEESYPLVLFDALRVKIREEGLVRNKAVYIALGVQADGTKDILGLLDRKYRRRQILAARDERAEELDQLLVGRDPKEVFNKDGLFDELKKALAERVLNAEIDDHLDNEAGEGRKNHLSSRWELGARTCNARSASGSAAAGTW